MAVAVAAVREERDDSLLACTTLTIPAATRISAQADSAAITTRRRRARRIGSRI
jgi:hypothetical protein